MQIRKGKKIGRPNAAFLDFPSEGLVRIRQVISVVGLSRSTWLEMVRRGEAPKPLRIGPTKTLTAWRVQDIRSWLAEQGGES
jgi:predicted DNA-binding transcriptional regulator AlpA